MVETAPAVVAQERATLPSPRCFSVDEYHRMAEAGILTDDERVELIEGKIVHMPPIGNWHAGDTNFLMHAFMTRLSDRATLTVQNPLRISSGSEPVPDLLVLRPDPNYYRGGHPGPADVLLLVEVSDTTLSYDRGTKLDLYAAAGIPEYWIVDVGGQRILSYRAPVAGEYTEMTIVGREGTVSPLAFPDLVLQVADVLGPA